MSTWLATPLLVASLLMVLLALVPRRYWYVQLPAVVGWVAVWIDGELTGQWFDVAGCAVVAASMGLLAAIVRPGRANAARGQSGRRPPP